MVWKQHTAGIGKPRTSMHGNSIQQALVSQGQDSGHRRNKTRERTEASEEETGKHNYK